MWSWLANAFTAAKGALTAQKVGTAAVKALPTIVGSSAKAAFDKRQADTGYSRAYADMKRAGINPILAGKVGPLAAAQMSDLGSQMSTARQLSQVDQRVEMEWEKLESDLDEAQSRIAVMSEEQLSKQADNYIKDVLVDFYKKNPNIGVFHALGGTPGDIIKAIDTISFKGVKNLLNKLFNKGKK